MLRCFIEAAFLERALKSIQFGLRFNGSRNKKYIHFPEILYESVKNYWTAKRPEKYIKM